MQRNHTIKILVHFVDPFVKYFCDLKLFHNALNANFGQFIAKCKKKITCDCDYKISLR